MPFGTWTDHNGESRWMTASDIVEVVSYKSQVNVLTDAQEDICVDSVDKSRGQGAPEGLIPMTSSRAEGTPRGLEFSFARDRIFLALSRSKALS